MSKRRNDHRIARHAIARWRERVDQHSSPAQGFAAIEQILCSGRRRSSGHSWTGRQIKGLGRGVVAVVWSELPDVAVILNITDRVAMTVVTRR